MPVALAALASTRQTPAPSGAVCGEHPCLNAIDVHPSSSGHTLASRAAQTRPPACAAAARCRHPRCTQALCPETSCPCQHRPPLRLPMTCRSTQGMQLAIRLACLALFVAVFAAAHRQRVAQGRRARCVSVGAASAAHAVERKGVWELGNLCPMLQHAALPSLRTAGSWQKPAARAARAACRRQSWGVRRRQRDGTRTSSACAATSPDIVSGWQAAVPDVCLSMQLTLRMQLVGSLHCSVFT